MDFLKRLMVATAMILGIGNVQSQDAPRNTPTSIAQTDAKEWAFSASASVNIVPNEQEYVQPTFTADRGWLHLETRYNYESLETGSVWVGCNFTVGKKLVFAATPMLGGVFGNTTGVAPGYEFSLTYGKLELSSQGEFVFDTGNSAGSFFYNWSELIFSPVDWFQFGLVAQRTQAYQTDVDLQRGLLVGFSHKKMDFTTSVLNLDRGKPIYIFSVSVNF